MRFKKLTMILLSVSILVSMLFMSGCETLTDTSQTTTTSNTEDVSTTTTTGQTGAIVTSGTEVTIPIVTGTTDPLASIADVAAMVKPSVVAINVKVVTTVYDFFGREYEQEQEGAGSGWIISEDGLIVTNSHVIEGATSILVTFDDGTSLPVDLDTVKADALTDIAVFKVDATGLPAVQIGNSESLREGEWVVAIGNSLGEGIRVTQGIVSRKDVALQDETGQILSGLLETDAVINPGNSGGPLVNMAGQVIGITNAKRVQTGVEGVGYAISINEASPIIQDLINLGYIVRPYSGINSETIYNSSYARWYGLGVNSGVRITSVSAGSPAEAAGLQENDVIVKFNGQAIVESQELVDAINKAEIGQTVDVEYYRGADKFTVQLTLAETPNPEE